MTLMLRSFRLLTIGRLPRRSLDVLEKLSSDLSEQDDLVFLLPWLEADSNRASLSSSLSVESWGDGMYSSRSSLTSLMS